MSNRFSIVVFGAVAGVSLVALYRLLALEFESGDAYPEYSSYRADPLGLLALHEAVASLPGPAPARNLVPLDSARFPDDATVLFAGAQPSPDRVKTLERLERVASGGGRLVILFRPDMGPWWTARRDAEDEKAEEDENAGEVNEEESEAQNAESESPADDDATKNASEDASEDERSPTGDEMLDALMPMEDIGERWGFGYSRRLTLREPGDAHLAPDAPELGVALPEAIVWHSAMAFEDVADEWTVIYRRGPHPVVIERAWDNGSIVVATDNFSVTNEAMRDDRHPGYVAWLIGDDRPLVFEETHLGVARRPGVMALVRRYGLLPVLVAAIALLALYVWRNVASLVPKTSAGAPDGTREAAFSTVAGIANLARRAIPPSGVLDECWRQYAQAPGHRSAGTQAIRSRVEDVLEQYRRTPRRKRDTAAAYNSIQAIVNERRSDR